MWYEDLELREEMFLWNFWWDSELKESELLLVVYGDMVCVSRLRGRTLSSRPKK